MKNFIQNLILPVAILTIFAGFAPRVLAVDPLEVVFERTPLFGEVNFLPGDSKDGDVTVTNNTDGTQNVYAESVNGFDPDGLGSQLNLKVFENGNLVPVYQDEFDDFLAAGPVSLSSLGIGATKTYTFVVSFINSEDNSYQGKSLGFDLCIGFSGGNFKCGDTVIGGEGDTGGDDGGGGNGGGSGGGSGGGQIPGGSGGGSGSSGQFVQLVVFNESVTNIDTDNGTATITWNTNLLSTSQVIYGPVPPGGYALNTNILPNLGYPLGTIEDSTKVTNHSVVLTGLAPGTYLYRVVSRASPPTVSIEHTFTMPTTSAGNFGVIASANLPFGASNTGEEGSDNAGAGQFDSTESTSTEETVTADNSNLLAFALGGLNFDWPGLVCVGVAMLIFLALLALVWLISRNSENKPLSRDIILLIIFGIIVTAVLWFIPYTCPTIPFWAIVIIYIVWKLIFSKHSN